MLKNSRNDDYHQILSSTTTSSKLLFSPSTGSPPGVHGPLVVHKTLRSNPLGLRKQSFFIACQASTLSQITREDHWSASCKCSIFTLSANLGGGGLLGRCFLWTTREGRTSDSWHYLLSPTIPPIWHEWTITRRRRNIWSFCFVYSCMRLSGGYRSWSSMAERGKYRTNCSILLLHEGGERRRKHLKHGRWGSSCKKKAFLQKKPGYFQVN